MAKRITDAERGTQYGRQWAEQEAPPEKLAILRDTERSQPWGLDKLGFPVYGVLPNRSLRESGRYQVAFHDAALDVALEKAGMKILTIKFK